MKLRSGLGSARRLVLETFYSKPVRLADQSPTVSFCFDDFPRTAYAVGGAILKRVEARGTYYTAPALMNTSSELGEQFTEDDLLALLAEGHELGCHTFTHVSCRKVPAKEFESDVRRGRETLHHLTGVDPVNFAYPFGHVALSAKNNIGKYMKSCRGIHAGVNTDMVDLALLRANSVYGGIEGFGEYSSLLSACKHGNGWVIFYTHDVRETPSPFGCTPALFEKVVSTAAEQGFRIATVREVLDCLPDHRSAEGQKTSVPI